MESVLGRLRRRLLSYLIFITHLKPMHRNPKLTTIFGLKKKMY
ncbi:hypothetical protein BN1221_03687 [Brenneria goodwinii]|uniref:Uncharacterized protein n=1 Tax=Brenneria goodwinii TaxID=1109412 RepID=A0A0G4JZA7_9GAMM|nr:hypothetical protein BN1221_03687 [Brenneria goodwinii]